MSKNNDKSDWATGGGLLMGLGIGFFFIQVNVMLFVGCLLAGLGLGLIITSLISSKKN
jgi:hypothetical protein